MINRTIPVVIAFIGILYLVQGQDTTRIPKGLTKPPFTTQYDTAQAVNALKRNLDALFTTQRYQRSDVSVKVRSLTRGVTLYERNARKPLTPASNTKLFSTNAVFYALGKEGMITTEVRTKGRIGPDGTLKGDLYLVGHGDAMLTVNDIEEIADNLFAMGLRRVQGTIYGDPTWFDKETNRAVYSGDGEDVVRLPPVEALTHSGGKIAIVVSATSKGYIGMQTIPASDAFVLDRVTTRKSRRSRIRVSSTVRKDGKQVISVSGSPGANRTKTVYVDMRNPALSAAGMLSNRLRSGGIMNDTLIGIKKAPADARVIASFKRPFADFASVVNKRSHNYFAEHVFKMVGALYGDHSTTAATSKKMMLAVLDSMGVDRSGAVFNDGSGLSRRNLVSAHTEVGMLEAIFHSHYGRDFYNTLAIAGVDGTIRGRMIGTPADSNVHAKTGTLRNVSSLGGYVTTQDGELLAFTIISNGPYKRTYKGTEDQAAILLADFSYEIGRVISKPFKIDTTEVDEGEIDEPSEEAAEKE